MLSQAPEHTSCSRELLGWGLEAEDSVILNYAVLQTTSWHEGTGL